MEIREGSAGSTLPALHVGPYRTPRFRIGERVDDERRGLVRIVKISDGRIPWPIAKGPGGLSPVLYRDRARAVHREAAAAAPADYSLRFKLGS